MMKHTYDAYIPIHSIRFHFIHMIIYMSKSHYYCNSTVQHLPAFCSEMPTLPLDHSVTVLHLLQSTISIRGSATHVDTPRETRGRLEPSTACNVSCIPLDSPIFCITLPCLQYQDFGWLMSRYVVPSQDQGFSIPSSTNAGHDDRTEKHWTSQHQL